MMAHFTHQPAQVSADLVSPDAFLLRLALSYQDVGPPETYPLLALYQLSHIRANR